MSGQSDVLYVADMARKFGRTERAIRALIDRKSKAVPPPFKLGGKWAWKREDVDSWINQQAGKAGDNGNA